MLTLLFILSASSLNCTEAREYPDSGYSSNYDYWVNFKGTNDKRCSNALSGCPSLNLAVRKIQGVKFSDITIQFAPLVSPSEKNATVFNKSMEVKGNGRILNVTGITSDSSASSLFTIGDAHDLIDVTFSDLVFNLISTPEQPMNLSLFSIGTGHSLSLRGITVSAESENMQTPLPKSLIVTTEGTLTISSSKFTNIIMASNPLISIPDNTKMNTITATFTNIKRNSGNGSVFEIVLEDNDEHPESFSLGQSTFVHCSVSESSGMGGAMYVTINAKAAPSPLVSPIPSFSGESTAKYGRYIYISTNCTDIADSESWMSVFTKSELRRNTVWVAKTGEEGKEIYDKTKYLLIADGESASTDADCGEDDKPCQTIEAAQKAANFQLPTIFIEGTVASSAAAVTLSNRKTFSSREYKDHKPVITVNPVTGDYAYIIKAENDITVTFNNVDFSISKGEGTEFSNSLFNVAKTLTLSTINILFSTSDMEFPKSLFDVDSGTFKWEDGKISGAKFPSGLVHVKSASVQFSYLTISDIALPKTSLIDSADDDKLFSVYLKSCSLSNITKDAGNGTIVCAKENNRITLQQNTFTNCVASAGNGGVLSSMYTSSLTITYNTFINCSAVRSPDSEKTTGFGGALCLEIDKDSTETFTNPFSSNSYSGCVAGDGNNYVLYVPKQELFTYNNFYAFIDEYYANHSHVVYDCHTGTPEVFDLYTLQPTTIIVDPSLLDVNEDETVHCEEKTAAKSARCPTLIMAISYSNSEKNPTISLLSANARLLSDSLDETSVSISKPLSVVGEPATVSVPAFGSYNPVISTNANISFENITFTLNATKYTSSSTRTIFYVKSDLYLISFTIKGSSISAFEQLRSNEKTYSVQSALESPIIKVYSSGYLHLKDVTMNQITLKNVALLDVPSQVIYTDQHYDLSHLQFIGNNNKFESIIRKEGNGSVLSLAVEMYHTFELTGGIFEDCVSENGNGGAISVIVAPCAGLTLGSTKPSNSTDPVYPIFNKCRAQLSDPLTADEPFAYGGAMQLMLAEPYIEHLKLHKINFTDNEASKSSSAFILVSDEKFGKNKTLFKEFMKSGGSSKQYLYSVLKPSGEYSKATTIGGGFFNFLPWWAWIVIIASAVLLVVLIVIIIVCCCCCRKRESDGSGYIQS